MPSTPVVSSALNPTQSQGSTHIVSIFGSGFVSGATVVFSGTGVNLSGAVTFVNSGTLTILLVVDSGATLGVRDITVTNPDTGTGTGTGIFTVTAAISAPTITGISPTTLEQYETGNLTITGTGFVSGAVATVDSGTVHSTTFNSSTSLTVNVTISGTATLAGHGVTVINPDTGNAIDGGDFSVTPGVSRPTISLVAPNTVQQGAEQSVIITGTGFLAGFTITASGTGITELSSNLDSDTELNWAISADSGATPGVRDLTVTNSDTGTVTAAGSFTVIATSTPVITSISPTSMVQDSTGNVVFHGTGFVDGVTADVDDAGNLTGVNTNSVTFNSSTQITLSVTTASGATVGVTDVAVYNPDGGTFNLAASFTVTSGGGGGGGGGGGLSVTVLSPSSFDQGTSGDIAVTGTGFASGIIATVAGSNITVNSTTFNSSTSVTVNITVAGGAGISLNELTFTNPDATAVEASVGTTIPSSYSLSAWRWVLTDSTVPESYTMEINPNAGGSLGLQKNITTYQLTADDGEMVLYEGSDSPQLVVVSGTLLTQAQYNHMVYWYSKRRPIQLTDDLARTMWVYFAVFTPTRAWSFQYPWRHTWSASFYVVGQQAVTAL